MSEYIVTCDDETASWIGDEVDSMEPVVRCRDCKWLRVDMSDHEYRSGYWCDMGRFDPKLDGFCAWGEKMVDA